MGMFKDSAGNSYSIELPFGTVIRVRKAEPRFDLLDAQKGNLYHTLHQDLGEFWELLWHIIEPQAIEKNISAETFGKFMTPECLLLAQGVFFKEWAEFFRSLQRENEAVALEKLGAYQAKAVAMIRKKLEGQEMKDLDVKTEQAMERQLNRSFGELQALLESTPDLSPTEN